MPPWFGLFYITVIVAPLVIAYGVIGIVLLAIFKKPISIMSIVVFTGAGTACGFGVMLFYLIMFGILFDEPNATVDLGGLFVAGGHAALSGSFIAVNTNGRYH
ncbi:MAG: hypothetical protein V3R90_00170 [Limibaculum sp.]